ncbi:hypothetical protein [Paenibacillus sp. R14(2021)]|uniref:hypothetical protein n=1 Tax=Paenibacillus sp. R14(2021) TaxID=2859228 RepID=UPI001C615BC0|nr:hypothetical protein [Paenibacillus sp. R14(2021)]
MRVTNIGNAPAYVTLFGLVQDETTLDIQSIRINGRPVTYRPGEGLYLGLLRPSETVEVTYRLRVSDHPLQNRIRFRIRAVYTYGVDQQTSSNSAFSNEAAVWIESDDE